jgi:hypothetical protein
VLKDKRFFSAANQQARRRERLEMEEGELERPTESKLLSSSAAPAGSTIPTTTAAAAAAGGEGCGGATPSIDDGDGRRRDDDRPAAGNGAGGGGGGGVPGRRLDGRKATAVAIPGEFRRRPAPHRVVARQAAVREWEMRVTYGNNGGGNGNGGGDSGGGDDSGRKGGALLDGRVFFAARGSYPVAVFSTIKYEPKKEETLRRRKQLEELGGGGTQFVLPERDWSECSVSLFRLSFPPSWSPPRIPYVLFSFFGVGLLGPETGSFF